MTIKNNRGFTLIEILVVIGLIALLAATVIVAVNPARQFAQGRNSQRISNVNAILNAIGQNIADNRGIFTCNGAAYELAEAASGSAAEIKKDQAGGDIRPCIVPAYISEIPLDPAGGTNTCGDENCDPGDYNTGYTVSLDDNGRITVCAPNAATETAISASEEPLCATR
jgi:type IV pilus assembly protein PilA